MRLMGLDYGSKTVGVAVSDPLGLTAQGVETVWRKQENKLRQTLARIEELISEYQVAVIEDRDIKPEKVLDDMVMEQITVALQIQIGAYAEYN